MSLQDDVHNWLSSTYDSARDAYEDIRGFVPGTLLIGGVPTPIQSSIDLLFGNDWQRAETIEAYATIFGGARQTASSEADGITRAVQPLIQENSMSQLIVPNCFQVSIQMVAGGHAIENVVGVQNSGGTAAGAAAAVLAAWKVASGPLNGLSALLTMVQVRAVDIGSANGAIVVVPDTTAGGVASANSFATRAASALIQWNGGTRSRSSRGRLYFGPIMETDISSDGATLVGVTPTTFKNRFIAFQNSLNSASYPLVVLSRKLSQAFPVTSVTCESLIATQRRRIR